ncbi:MAG: pitrilysin family protein [Acidobacteriota bacterium]|nr:pitrilysin family protein [Acidobacteriota bacterium]
MTCRISSLANGMRVATEWMPAVETVSLGFWLPRGSRHEDPVTNGMFHFIEHTLFKGTSTRGARDIAEAVDSVGGVLDAYTAKEETCYSFKVREKHLPVMLDILADMLQHPLFDPEELTRERRVVLEEIKMEEDNPEDLAYERSLQNLWTGHPIGRPILGTVETVAAFDHDAAAAFHRRFYHSGGLVVSAAGKVDHDQLCDELTQRFPIRDALAPAPSEAAEKPAAQGFQVYLPRPHLEQVNFCLNFEAEAYTHPDRDALYLLNTLLGGSMSSRLFQRIREENGLAYSVGSFTSLFSDCGMFTIYGGCSPENFEKVLTLAFQVVAELLEKGIPQAELARAREQLIGNTLMGLETTGSRASSMARDLMLLDRPFDLVEAIAALEAVDLPRVTRAAEDLFTRKTMGLFAVGRLPGDAPEKPWSLTTV